MIVPARTYAHRIQQISTQLDVPLPRPFVAHAGRRGDSWPNTPSASKATPPHSTPPSSRRCSVAAAMKSKT